MERYGIGKVRSQSTSETEILNITYMANMVISTKLSSVSNMPNMPVMPYLPSLTDKSKLSNKTNIAMLFAIINSTKATISTMTISPI